MAIPQVGGLLLGVGLSVLSGQFRKPRRQEALRDDRPPTLSLRGEFLPYVIGRREVGPLIGYIHPNPTVTTEGGGGGKGTPEGGGQTIYHQKGLHFLTLGPAFALRSIRQGGAVIWDAGADARTTPSGSEVNLGAEGRFRIYFGEVDQPADPDWSDPEGLNTASLLPFVMSVWWDTKRLGGQTQWPSLEYEVENRCCGVPLMESDHWIEESEEDAGDSGVNAAHALYQLMRAPHPWGASIPAELLDLDAFEALGVRCAEEHCVVNMLVRDGDRAAGVIADLIQDHGITLPRQRGVIAPRTLRAVEDPGTLPVVTQDMIVGGAVETEQKHGRATTDRIIYEYADRAHAYSSIPLTMADDAAAQLDGRSDVRRVQLPTVADALNAARVADRRILEDRAAAAVYSFDVTRAAAWMPEGTQFVLEGVGQCVVAAIRPPSAESAVARVEAIRDLYSRAGSGYSPPAPPGAPGQLIAEPDTVFRPIEAPHPIAQAEPLLLVPRVRAHASMVGAAVQVSADGGASYAATGAQDAHHAGGTLDADLPADARTLLEHGPIITRYNADLASIPNLPDEEWRAGRLLCLMGSEILFARGWDPVPGQPTKAQLRGLIRARFDTRKGLHLAGSAVLLALRESLAPQRAAVIAAGVTLRVKTIPRTGSQSVDPGDVTGQLVAVVGRNARPLPVDNLRANGGASYAAGGDVDLTWTYRVRDGGGSAAGEQLAGVPIASSAPPVEGAFRVEILDATDDVVRTVEGLPSPAYSYDNASLVSDFGGEPATLKARVANVNGARVGATVTITITKE